MAAVHKLTELFQPPSAYAAASTINHEAAPAFVRSDEERLAQVLLTGTFEPTCYETPQALATEAQRLFVEWANRDPRFLAQAIVYARNKGLIRLAPIVALYALSANPATEAKMLFKLIFPRVIWTPGDLQDFLTLCRKGKSLRGVGRLVRTAVQTWLANISEYHAIKYGSEHQAFSLRDIYRAMHPKLSGQANIIAHYLVKGVVSETTPQIAGYERFKHTAAVYKAMPAPDHEGYLYWQIEHYRLPWEVVSGLLPQTTDAWYAMMRQMPYMALLRNLNNMVTHKVFERQHALDYACQTIADPERVAKSHQFPFAFYNAWKALSAEGEIRQQLNLALEYAVNASFQNMPDLGGKVLICNDISGSMGTHMSDKSDLSYAEAAAVFAAAAYKKAPQGEIVSFNEYAVPQHVDRETHLLNIVRQIAQDRGGTNLSAPLDYALRQGHTYDTCIFITDDQSWVDHLRYNHGVVDVIRQHRQRNPRLTCFFIRLDGYKTAQVPSSEPGVYYISGWSDAALGFVASVAGGGQTQLEAIRQVDLLAA